MRLHIPFIPFIFDFTAEKRPLRRPTILGLIILIAVLALGMGVVRLSERSANDWAMDRREVEKHIHEASFHSRMLNDTRAYQSDHPTDSSRIWAIHGEPYRVGPDLERYLEAMIAYHQRRASRHEAAIGRWWDNVPPESPPEPPPRVPVE
jgi:hypothetical protein